MLRPIGTNQSKFIGKNGLRGKIFNVTHNGNHIATSTLIQKNFLLTAIPKDESIGLEVCKVELSSGNYNPRIILRSGRSVVVQVPGIESISGQCNLKITNPIFLLENDPLFTVSAYDGKARIYQASERFFENFRIRAGNTYDDEDILNGAPIFNSKGGLIGMFYFTSRLGCLDAINYFKLKPMIEFMNYL